MSKAQPKIKLGVVMDPLDTINYQKDTTLAFLWEAAARGWEIYYFELQDLFLLDGVPFGNSRLLQVYRDPQKWYSIDDNKKPIALADLNIILMRKDPPFNEKYIYATYILEHADRRGVVVANKPQSLRDANEKLYTTYFPECTPPTMVTQQIDKLMEFWHERQDIVCKPLDSMGGNSIFRVKKDDVNARVIFETLTHDQSTYIMAQQFIPEIVDGDKRILMIDGEAFPHALARVPQAGDWRGNLVVGAKGKVQPLTDRDRFICSQLGPILRERGLYFVGLDVIGDYLTEVNVTSPTGVRQLEEGTGENISAMLLDVLERKAEI